MAEKRKRTIISESIKEILEREYQNGLKSSAGPTNKAKIARLSAETGHSDKQITYWIGNYRSKTSKAASEQASVAEGAGASSSATDDPVSKVPFFRKANSWNIFYSYHAKQDPYASMEMKERNVAIKTLYINQTEEEKKRWQMEAREVQQNPYSPEVVKKMKTQLQSQFQFLEKAGVRAVCLLNDQNDTIWSLGSSDADHFLDSHPEVEHAYRTFLSIPQKYSNNHVKELFNTKFAESLNKAGAVVSYTKYNQGKFTVEGMPAGVPFQKPNVYGATQISKIMESKEAIRFIIKDKDSLLTRNRKPCEKKDFIHSQQSQVLLKIVDEEVVRSILNNERKGCESDLDVTIALSLAEKKILASCLEYFDTDGQILIKETCKVNNQSVSEEDIVVIPCYADTTTEEIFWLFQTKETELHKKKISGRWLELVSEPMSYKIWSSQDEEIEKGNAVLRKDDFIRLVQGRDFHVNQSTHYVTFTSHSLNDIDTFMRCLFNLD